MPCPGLEGPGLGSAQEQTLDNLCGDLNKGYLPVNPIGQNVLGVSYPFELIKNKTLDFFSKTLPILKADDTLPKVAKYQDSHIMYNPTIFNSQVDKYFYCDMTVNIFTFRESAAQHQDQVVRKLPQEARHARGRGGHGGGA